MLFSNLEPRYFPHLEYPQLLHMGLKKINPQQWIEPDASLPLYHRHKLEQRQLYGDRVYRATPGSLDAQRELQALLCEHLLTDHPDVFRRSGNRLISESLQLDLSLDGSEPLWLASQWVADDLVIMQPAAQGYYLSAASLCSPSHWRLEDKFGQQLAAIHAPIPGFTDALDAKVARFFEHLQAPHLLQRFNWTVQAGTSLDWRPGQEFPVTTDTPLSWRVERQTLRRLPATGAIAFTIRVYVHSLESLQACPGALPALFSAIAGYAPEQLKYKSFARLAPALERFRTLI